ncbi:hypothetical protein D3C86_2012460 [compost metagenome]
MHLLSKGRKLHGFIALRLGDTPNRCVAEHQVPVEWVESSYPGRIYTGGAWYSTEPGGDLTPPERD